MTRIFWDMRAAAIVLSEGHKTFPRLHDDSADVRVTTQTPVMFSCDGAMFLLTFLEKKLCYVQWRLLWRSRPSQHQVQVFSIYIARIGLISHLRTHTPPKHWRWYSSIWRSKKRKTCTEVQIIHRLTPVTPVLHPTASMNSISVLTSSTNQGSILNSTQTNHHLIVIETHEAKSLFKLQENPRAQTIYSQQHYVTVLLCWPIAFYNSANKQFF